jgi:hypothetical protein
MDNKEAAEKLREIAGYRVTTTSDAAALKKIADELDTPKKKYEIDTYVNTNSGIMRVIARSEFLKVCHGLCYNDDATYLLDERRCVQWRPFGSDLSKWIPTEADKNNQDENGNICPAGFSVSQKFEKGKIYKTKLFNTPDLICIRFFDGNRFFMPGQEDNVFEEMGDKASHNDICNYFKQSHGAGTAMFLALEFAKTLKE